MAWKTRAVRGTSRVSPATSSYHQASVSRWCIRVPRTKRRSGRRYSRTLKAAWSSTGRSAVERKREAK